MHFSTAAARLKQGKEDVLKVFEHRSREAVAAAKAKDAHTIRNELSYFLDALIVKLTTPAHEGGAEEQTSAEHHGQQRAGLTGYTLKQVIKEYGILREIIIEQLLFHGPLSENERRIVHASVDHALEFASDEFAKAEQSQIKLALAKAEASNRELDQFAAITAHDLRSPLGTIAGFAEILKEDFADHANQQAKDCLNYIDSATKRMTSLIDGILSYAKLNGQVEALQPVSCEEAVKSATQNLKQQLTENSGRIGHSPLPTVLGSLPLLSQLFQNLFANSIRYRSEKPPEIDVTLEDSADVWTFLVRDNGIGFDPEFKEVIFQVHKQLNTKRRMDGSGLGLATCRRVVEIHGGKIWAESVLGEGTSFFFTIPKIKEAKI